MEEFTVKLERFSGPYSKLLEMIESRKLSITEVGLTAVADDYINYIKNLQTEDNGNLLVDISQFIVVASTLMLMKAKSLLPGLIYTAEDEKQIHNLEHKLELYASLIKASNKIKNIYFKSQLFERHRTKYKDISIFVPDNNVTTGTLHSIAVLTVASFRLPENLVKAVVEQKLRIENVIDDLISRIRTNGNTSLFKMVEGFNHSFEEKKKMLIVNFLALLELVRMGNFDAEQEDNSGDIMISAK